MSAQLMPKASPPRPWSEIPLDLAYLMLRRLPTQADRIRFSAVCSHWCTAARELRLPPPLLVLPDGTAYSLSSDELFPFPRCAGYIDACGNWLVFWGEDKDDEGYYFLVDPFSDATVTLPTLSPVRLRPALGKPKFVAVDLVIHKLMFCSPDLVAALVHYRRCTRIAVCQPGVSSSWWTVRVGDDWMPQFVDIAFHEEKLYALDHTEGDLYSMDISTNKGRDSNPWISQVRWVIDGSFPGSGGDEYMYRNSSIAIKTMYLVESRGDLLMVLRTARGVVKSVQWRGKVDLVDVDGRNMFKVFRADFEQSRWIEVTTLGDDQVLFLRRRCCRSVCASHIDTPGDCIVFMENDDEDHYWYDQESSSSCAIYNMKCGSISTFLPTPVSWKRSWKHGTAFPTWFFPNS